MWCLSTAQKQSQLHASDNSHVPAAATGSPTSALVNSTHAGNKAPSGDASRKLQPQTEL